MGRFGVGFEGHDLGLAGAAIVLPGEADPAVIEGHDAAVGDGDAVGVARQIGKHEFAAVNIFERALWPQ